MMGNELARHKRMDVIPCPYMGRSSLNPSQNPKVVDYSDNKQMKHLQGFFASSLNFPHFTGPFPLLYQESA